LPDGIAVWAATGADGKTARIALPRAEVFAFHLRVRNPDFALFTDLKELAGKTDPSTRTPHSPRRTAGRSN
jgi:hypothetical protein